MTEEQAAATAAWLNREYGLTSIVVDPSCWMTLHIDATTVRVLAAATERHPDGGHVAAGMSEEFYSWLTGAGEESDRA